jgi:hypothetical protein
MTESDSTAPKKKKLKLWQILLISIFALTILGMLFGEDTEQSNPSPDESSAPKVMASFSGEVTNWEPLNPASGRATFTILNTGTVAGSPESCTVRVQDDSGTYKGFDYISGFDTIAPGENLSGNVVLTVTKEGSSFVTQGSITCD